MPLEYEKEFEWADCEDEYFDDDEIEIEFAEGGFNVEEGC